MDNESFITAVWGIYQWQRGANPSDSSNPSRRHPSHLYPHAGVRRWSARQGPAQDDAGGGVCGVGRR